MHSNHILSIIIPCYNEEETLAVCINRVLAIEDDALSLEIIVVDDGSTDESFEVAKALSEQFHQVRLLRHASNQGKGAALSTGFKEAKGHFVAVQDADLEYNPQDLKYMIEPLIADEADVVLGSRYLSSGSHRVLFFWHSIANQFLTFLSNMFTDLNLTDMECCYKVFRKDVIQQVDIQEKGFGIEPELVAKVAHMRVRIYERGVSYRGRTYDEGKKIGFYDSLRALYCIIRYNTPHAPLPIQFFFYVLINILAAVTNLGIFLLLMKSDVTITMSTLIAFWVAAIVNYFLCIFVLFRHNAKWSSAMEILMFIAVVALVGVFDLGVTKYMLALGISALPAKLIATGCSVFLNFLGRRYLVFPEPTSGPWRRQN